MYIYIFTEQIQRKAKDITLLLRVSCIHNHQVTYNNTKHSSHELQRQDLSFQYFSKSVHGQFKGCQGNRIYRRNLGLSRTISQYSHS